MKRDFEMGRYGLIGLMLLFVAVWGWTFTGVKQAIEAYEVVGFLAIRFVVAAIAIGLPCIGRFCRRSFVIGASIGIVLASTYLLQTFALITTSATNGGIITGLFILFVPLANRLLFGKPIEQTTWWSVGASLAGLALLAGHAPDGLTIGDFLTVCCAGAMGVHIALIDRYAKEVDATSMAFGQIASAASIFVVLWLTASTPSLPPAEVWPVIIATALIATAGGFFVQILVQRQLSALQTASILMLEPVFAGLFAYWLAGDRLGPLQWTGAIIMVSATAATEIWTLRKRLSSTGAQPVGAAR
jgi:drug/metabolite transporter (DMT)-like permease